MCISACLEHNATWNMLEQGINMSQGGSTIAIKVRLRRPSSNSTFFDFHFILGTLLHEMSHIVHPHHQPPFWKLYHALHAVRVIASGVPHMHEAQHHTCGSHMQGHTCKSSSAHVRSWLSLRMGFTRGMFQQ